MKVLLFSLILIASAAAHAQFDGADDYITFQRNFFGQELPGGLYEITQPDAFNARAAQIANSDHDDESLYEFIVSKGRYLNGRKHVVGEWMQIVRRPVAEPSYETPSVFVFSIPNSDRKFAVLGIHADINGVSVNEDANGITRLTITGTHLNFEEVMETMTFEVNFSNEKGRTRLPYEFKQLQP
jgi:hypothetical protein